MRILICGGRNFNDAARFGAVMDRLHKRRQLTLIIHGAAPGADTLAEGWAIQNGVDRRPFPANWLKHGAAAGPIRNQQMLTDGRPEAVVAFPGGKGTADMTRRAEAQGLPVWRPLARVNPNEQKETP